MHFFTNNNNNKSENPLYKKDHIKSNEMENEK